MVNPGSPEQIRAQQMANPPAFPKGMMTAMLMTLVIMFAVMGFRDQIGAALNVVFCVIDFDGKEPVLTLIIGGLIMITLSTIIRFFITDSVTPAMMQYKQKIFNQEFRQARLENNLAKLKKYEAIQPKILEETQKNSMNMMITMPVTMLVIIPIYAWINFFVTKTLPPEELIVAMPWGHAVLTDPLFLGIPLWIFLYSLISLPIGQLEQKILLFFKLGKRLEMIDKGITPPPFVPFWKKIL